MTEIKNEIAEARQDAAISADPTSQPIPGVPAATGAIAAISQSAAPMESAAVAATEEVKKTIENDGHGLLHRLAAAFYGDEHAALTWLESEAHRIAAKL